MSKRIDIWPYGAHELDDATGLPVVPEGMFWRIRKTINPFAHVELRRKLAIGSTLVERAVCYRFELTGPREILSTCAFVLNQVHKNRRLEKAAFKPWGDYPPRKLGSDGRDGQ